MPVPKLVGTILTRELAENLAIELDYYQRRTQEQQEIIEQLTGTGKPKGYIYIHPLDIAELFEKHCTDEAVFVDVENKPEDDLIRLDGKVYKMSPYIPVKTTKYQSA